jgi:hypothetical protein
LAKNQNAGPTHITCYHLFSDIRDERVVIVYAGTCQESFSDLGGHPITAITRFLQQPEG